jgi:hypothetical protein
MSSWRLTVGGYDMFIRVFDVAAKEGKEIAAVTEVDNVLDDDPLPRRVSWSLWRVVAAVLLFAMLAAAVGEVVSGADTGNTPTRRPQSTNGQLAPRS